MTTPKRGRGRPPKSKPLIGEILPPTEAETRARKRAAELSADPNVKAAIAATNAAVRKHMLNPENAAQIERWPSKLPVEVALGLATTDEKVLKAYDLTQEEWDWIQRNPEFQEVCEQYREQIKSPADEFKMKTQILSDDHLKTAHRMIVDPDTPAPQKVDLMKTLFRMAGYDNKNTEAGVGAQVGLSINLILGDK